MCELSIKSFKADDLPAMSAVMARAIDQCADRDMPNMQFCFHPAFAGGRNILCAWREQSLLGFAQIFPWGMPDQPGQARRVMLEIKVDPLLDDAIRVKEALFTRVMNRLDELAAETPDYPLEPYVCYFSTGVDSLHFFSTHGFVPQPSLLLLRRDGAEAAPAPSFPAAVESRITRLTDNSDRHRWLAVHNTALPDNREDEESLESYLHAPFGPSVTTCTAYADNEIVGSILYWIEPDPQQQNRQTGKIERLFVVDGWRRQGIARALLRTVLHELSKHGIQVVRLDTSQENTAAVHLYLSEGFRLVREVDMLVLRQ